MAALDFTSALYLGLRHPHPSLAPWLALTEGKPAVLGQSLAPKAIAQELAGLQGCERGTLAVSTLHLFWDLFGILAQQNVSIYMDTHSYATVQWGAERAAALGVQVRRFPHHCVRALREFVCRDCRGGFVPVIVTDGYCPSCNRLAPLIEYAAIVEGHGGYLVLDDTQALGVLGRNPNSLVPLGEGGGGSLRHLGIKSPNIVVGSSLAKAFGAPVAVLSGSDTMIGRFEQLSQTRVHCSPPSAAAVAAARRALTENRLHGEKWRGYLLALVSRFRFLVQQFGIRITGWPFPILKISLARGIDAAVLQTQLLQQGIRAAAVKSCESLGASVAFMITTLHDPADIDRAAATVGRIIRPHHSIQAISEKSS